MNGNPDLCVSGSCKKKSSLLLQFVAPNAAVVFVLLIVFIISWKFKKTGKGNVKILLVILFCTFEFLITLLANTMKNICLSSAKPLESRNYLFTYSEVESITNNFEKVIGKGGFGTVYYGLLNDHTEVAVKMLSAS